MAQGEVGHNDDVRYEAAVRRLRTVAARCQQANRLWDEEPFLTGA
jgi:hypothetical protein